MEISHAVSTTNAAVLALLVVPLLIFLYIRSNDAKLTRLPPEALLISPKRWTEEDIQSCYKTAQDGPVSLLGDKLPPKTGRRYIVIGGVSARRTHANSSSHQRLRQVSWADGSFSTSYIGVKILGAFACSIFAHLHARICRRDLPRT